MLTLPSLLHFHVKLSCRPKINFYGWVGLLEKWRIWLSSASTGFELGLWLSLAISTLEHIYRYCLCVHFVEFCIGYVIVYCRCWFHGIICKINTETFFQTPCTSTDLKMLQLSSIYPQHIISICLNWYFYPLYNCSAILSNMLQ